MWETLLVLRELDLKRHTGAVGAVELLRAFAEDNRHLHECRSACDLRMFPAVLGNSGSMLNVTICPHSQNYGGLKRLRIHIFDFHYYVMIT